MTKGWVTQPEREFTMLKFKIDRDAFETLPEVIQAEYKEAEKDSGDFVLQADGKSDADFTALKTALHKERKSNKENSSKLSKFGDLTMDDIEAMKSEIEDLKLKTKGEPNESDEKREEAIKERIKNALDTREAKYQRELASREKKIADLDKSVNDLTSKHRSDLLRRTVDTTLPETVHRTALDDILLHAERELEFSDDANEGKGGFVHADSGVSVAEWLDSKIADKPHWQKPSKSGGESGSDHNAPRGDKTANFKKAAEAGDIHGMITNAPVIP